MAFRKSLILRRPRKRPSRRTHGADPAQLLSHQLRPAPVKSAMVRLAVPVVAGYGPALQIEFLAPEAHLVTQRMAPRDDATPGLRAALPIVHVVLLERPARAE